MPGKLRIDAMCPKCGDPLLAITDTTTTGKIEREYAHEKWSAHHRRRRPCKTIFEGKAETDYANKERKGLEER